MNDSTGETLAHVQRVQSLINQAVLNLINRAAHHDDSKFQEPEKSAYDKLVGSLQGMEYGSDEYKRTIKETLGDALKHHYEHNSHHPEHYSNGISGMSLFDLVEMLVDWKASTERMKNGTGDIEKSLKLNIERFKIEPQLASILQNTINELKWKPQA